MNSIITAILAVTLLLVSPRGSFAEENNSAGKKRSTITAVARELSVRISRKSGDKEPGAADLTKVKKLLEQRLEAIPARKLFSVRKAGADTLKVSEARATALDLCINYPIEYRIELLKMPKSKKSSTEKPSEAK